MPFFFVDQWNHQSGFSARFIEREHVFDHATAVFANGLFFNVPDDFLDGFQGVNRCHV